jgi:hypothetical protein
MVSYVWSRPPIPDSGDLEGSPDDVLNTLRDVWHQFPHEQEVALFGQPLTDFFTAAISVDGP